MQGMPDWLKDLYNSCLMVCREGVSLSFFESLLHVSEEVDLLVLSIADDNGVRVVRVIRSPLDEGMR